MKGRLITALAAFFFVAAVLGVTAPAAKEEPPKAEKMKKLSFPDFKEFTTENGIEAIVVEHHEQPVATIYFLVKAGGALDPDGKESLASFVIDQLNKGTKSKSALELAEWIESVGGEVNNFSEEDYSGIAISILSDYLDTAYEYLADIFLNPTFPENELEILRKRVKTALEIELSDPGAMARRHLRDLVYGDHPYSKQATVASVEAVTRDDMVGFYNKNIVANNTLVAVVGDVKWKDVRKAMKKHFGAWQSGTPEQAAYTSPPKVDKTKIYLYHRPGAVQTEIYIGHAAIKADNPDWPAVIVANRVLGGGADARLFMNLREDKGWTYGAYSNFAREKDVGYFRANAAVRTEVTDSALVEFMKELDRIRTEPVSDEDLKNAKDYLIGNFPTRIETPRQIAQQVGEVKLLGLGKEELETYRDRLAVVTTEDVLRVMADYLHPNNAYVVLVGDAMELKDKVEGVGGAEVVLFDIGGEPLSFASLSVEGVSHEYDTADLKDMSATYSLVMQQMPLGDITVKLKQKKDEGTIEVSSSLQGMVQLSEKMEFRADNLTPISYRRSLSFGGNTMNTEFAFANGTGSGTVQGMESPEPKKVTFNLVEGTIMDGALEFAVGCLPLEVDKKYRFPVVDSESGALQNVDVTVVGEVTVETPAGSFVTYKIKVKRPAGEGFVYLGKKAPHIMVKTEVPAQAMTMELKNLAN